MTAETASCELTTSELIQPDSIKLYHISSNFLISNFKRLKLLQAIRLLQIKDVYYKLEEVLSNYAVNIHF